MRRRSGRVASPLRGSDAAGGELNGFDMDAFNAGVVKVGYAGGEIGKRRAGEESCDFEFGSESGEFRWGGGVCGVEAQIYRCHCSYGRAGRVGRRRGMSGGGSRLGRGQAQGFGLRRFHGQAA